MQRAPALAAPGVARAAPNPSVGCVIVRAGAVVGEGATQGEGGHIHGEQIALAAAGAAASGAVAYVTLEPCAARSAGGLSCAALLIGARVARVVIATPDPHPNAAGAGVLAMSEAGVLVELGLCEAEARLLNADF